MSQVTDYVMPGSPLTMAQLASELNADFAAIISQNSGTTAPASPVVGMPWLDTSGGATAYILKYYTAGGWVSMFGINSTTGAITRLYPILDEDTMATNSDLLPPSQQSTKAYVDTNVAANRGLMEFGNLSFTATAAAKALTVALKGTDGNNPSASNIVVIPFRSATLTSSIITKRTVTGALSVVLSSGSTLGFTAALAGRIYVWAIDNAGTVELALSRTADIFPEGNVVSTTAEGGAGAADSAAVMYSTTARASKACRCIGYIEITTGGTAGEWDNAATKIQVMGAGVLRTGNIVQIVRTEFMDDSSGVTTIPLDDTIPQITEGDEYMTRAITPTSAVNILRVRAQVLAGTSATWSAIAALFQDATANALKAITSYVNAENTFLALSHQQVAGTTSATTFRVRCGGNGGTFYFNKRAVGPTALFNVTANSFIEIEEVFA